MSDVGKVSSLNDVHLARMAARDKASAQKMLNRVYPKIFQVIRSAVRHREQADEIGQLVILEVLKGLGSFRGEGSLEAWAGGIAYKVTMRSLKNLRERERRHVPISEDSGVSVDNPEKDALRKEAFGSLLEKMDTIPHKRRLPLVLHLAYGYTTDEVSEIMGTSLNTTKDRLKTALREIRAIYDKNPALREAMLEEIQ